MAKMTPYPKYKPSGIEWIGDIPEHWKVKRLKYIAHANPSNIDKKSILGEEEVFLCNYMDVYKNDFITNDIDFMKATASDAQIQKFLLKMGDVLATKDSESADDIGIPALVKEDFENVVCGYHLTHIKPTNVNGSYLFRLLQTDYVKSYFETAANGVTRYALGVDDFNDISVLVPTPAEQTAIANYLDAKTAAIDELIATKQKLIELYEEEKTALINHAVTKGLNPNAPMKDSGIDWLGEIPEHWEVKKLKRLAKICNGQDHKNVWDDNGVYPIIGTGGIFGKANNYLHTGPSVILGRKGTIDKPQYLENPFWSVDTAYYTDIYNTILPKYFFYLCTTINFDQYKYGSAVPSMTQEVLNQIPFAIALNLKEQQAIVDYIETESKKIDTQIANTTQLIELLTEYRTALISEVVTGKINVTN
ncbi:MAG: restriction endonuclease subunit S [Chitinophagales bacterium]|nr:restriction endonuclease subunit S [Chitinophagales bacterium]